MDPVITAISGNLSQTIGAGLMFERAQAGDVVQIAQADIIIAKAWRESGRYQFLGTYTGRHSIRDDATADDFFAHWGPFFAENLAAHKARRAA